MARLRWLLAASIALSLVTACNKFQHKKPDPTKGVVTGIVLCADTGKLYRQTGWLPNMSFVAMIEEMVEMEVRGANATADSDLYPYL